MTASPMPLSFPPSVFATLAPASFLLANLTSPQSLRANGRKPSAFRTPIINTNSLRHCFGSAVVRIGDTAVVCGVRGEILRAEDVADPPRVDLSRQDAAANADEIRKLGLLVPNVELATGCSPANLPGNPPSTIAQTLSQRLLSLLQSTRLVNAADLRVLYRPPKTAEDEMEEPDVEPEVEIRAYWTLYIDILFISLDGNPLDAAWGSMMAALQNTVLPKAWWDPDLDTVICSNSMAEAKRLELGTLPIPATFAVFDSSKHKGMPGEERHWILADPDAFEEEMCGEAFTVTVDGKHIRRIEKSGGRIIGKESMKSIVQQAQQRWVEWRKVLGQPGG